MKATTPDTRDALRLALSRVRANIAFHRKDSARAAADLHAALADPAATWPQLNHLALQLQQNLRTIDQLTRLAADFTRSLGAPRTSDDP